MKIQTAQHYRVIQVMQSKSSTKREDMDVN